MMTLEEKYRKSKRNAIIICSVILAAFAVVTITIGILYATDLEEYYNEYLNLHLYENKIEYRIALVYFLTPFNIASIVFLLASIFGVKAKVYEYEGHRIFIYLGFRNGYLIIDNMMRDEAPGMGFSFSTVHMNAVIPDTQIPVEVKVNALAFNSYSVKIDNKFFH